MAPRGALNGAVIRSGIDGVEWRANPVSRTGGGEPNVAVLSWAQSQEHRPREACPG